MKRLLCLALFLWPVLTGPARLPAQELGSGIVQVAVNYGPRQDGFFSGVVVGDGRMVLTDGAIAARAREIAIAFSDGEILETVMAQIQYFNRVGVLPMTAHHGQIVPLSPLARETSPQADVEAVLGGALKAFQVDRRVVHLHPVGFGGTLRWQITPPPPPQFRGGPLLSSQGQLIAVVVLEGGALVGMPLGGEMLAMVDVSAGTPPAINAVPTTPATSNAGASDSPAIKSPEPPAPSRRSPPPDSPAPPAETKVEGTARPHDEAKPVPPGTNVKTSDQATATPAEHYLASVFKDAAIAPLHVEAPVIPKPMPPTVSGPLVTSVNVPLPPIRAAWAWKGAGPPPAEAVSVPAPQVAKQVAPPAPSRQSPPPDSPAPSRQNPPPDSPVRKTETPATVAAAPSAPATTAKPPEGAPRGVDTFLHQAAELMQKKEYPKAVDTLEEAIRVHPEAANLHFQLALAYWYKALQKPDGSRRSTMEKASYHKAIKSFQTFLEKAPNDPLANEARMRLTVLRNAQYGGG